MKKRIFALLLVLCLALTLLPGAAFADDVDDFEERIPYAVTGGNIYFIASTGTIVHADEEITEARIPSKIADVPVTNIDDDVFWNCNSLTSVSLPDSITSLGDNHAALYACSRLMSIEVDAANRTYCSLDGVLFSKDMKTLIVYPSGRQGHYQIPDGAMYIESGAFYSCSGLTSVTIPDSVTAIGASAFLDCTSLTDITLPNGITNIDYAAFANCASLTSVAIPDGMTTLSPSTFEDCSKLKTVILPDSIATIGRRAFYKCSALKNIIIPDSVTFIGDFAFSWCYNLTSINIPSGVTSIEDGVFSYCSGLTSIKLPEQVTAIKSDTFHSCQNLKSINIPRHVTEIGRSAFENCSSLKSITIPRGVSIIQNYAFLGCDNLTNVIMLDGVTSISYAAFKYCNKLESVVIPNSVTDIMPEAFHGCSNLQDVYYGGSEAQWTSMIDPFFHVELAHATVHYYYSTNVTDKFTDVPHNWAYEGIDYCLNTGLIVGTSETTFSPDEALTRGQFVTILWRQLGCPAPKGENPFTDLTQDYYKDAITWAAENKVVYGTGETTFEPDRAITRQELTTMFYRYVGEYLKQDVSGAADISTFPDYSSVADYAQAAMAWAKGVGLITGNEINGTIYLDPKGAATRAQAATMFMNLCEKVLK